MTEGRVDRMVLVYGRPGAKKRKPPRQEGDKKMIKGVLHVCRQETVMYLGQRCYKVNRGKPCLEWVPVEAKT